LKTKKILIQLVSDLEAFELQKRNDAELHYDEFLGFLFSKRKTEAAELREIGGSEAQDIQQSGTRSDSELSVLITLLYKYAKNYIRKAMANSVLQTPDEFGFLIVLITFPSLTKMELIQKNVMEKTSGMEVIRRLIRYGLVEQFDDEQDKRSQRVRITEKGKVVVYQLLPEMQKVGEVVGGDLNESEKLSLLYLLKKLDHFHHDLYTKTKQSNWDEVTEVAEGKVTT
jgi:DNA-binding MarR family transcriptional regulator